MSRSSSRRQTKLRVNKEEGAGQEEEGRYQSEAATRSMERRGATRPPRSSRLTAL